MELVKTGNNATVFPGNSAVLSLLEREEPGEPGHYFIESRYNDWAKDSSSLTELLRAATCHEDAEQAVELVLRWLDTVFQGQYLPSLSINYVAINEDLEKLTLHLY